jgi:hypothetical protein
MKCLSGTSFPPPTHPQRFNGVLALVVDLQTMREADDLVVRSVDHQRGTFDFRDFVDDGKSIADPSSFDGEEQSDPRHQWRVENNSGSFNFGGEINDGRCADRLTVENYVFRLNIVAFDEFVPGGFNVGVEILLRCLASGFAVAAVVVAARGTQVSGDSRQSTQLT